MMKEELDMKVRRSYFWTDSTCVLTYINKESTRFQEILSKDTGYIYMPYNTRAIHIEVAPTLDIDSFPNALRRFVARRGIQKELDPIMEGTL